MNMSDKSMARWGLIRQLGMWNFILSRGILGFGTGFALFNLARDVWQGHPIEHKELLVELGLQILLGGGFWGYLTWLWLEEKYQQRISAGPSPGNSQS